MKYSEFHYERISVEEQNALLDERLERFNKAASADEQIAVIKGESARRRQGRAARSPLGPCPGGVWDVRGPPTLTRNAFQSLRFLPASLRKAASSPASW